MSINKISEQILEICSRKDSDYQKDKQELYKLYYEIDRREIGKNEENVDALLTLHRELCKTKGRKASYWEHEIGRMLITHLPFAIIFKTNAAPEDIRILKEHYDENEDVHLTLRLSAKVLKYTKEIISSKPQKNRRYEKRIEEALKWIVNLHNYYIIEDDVTDIYMSFIHSKNEDLQGIALDGMIEYYSYEDAKKITKERIEIFENIIANTKSRSNAVAACEILINAEEMNEFDALMLMDDWKEKNWT